MSSFDKKVLYYINSMILLLNGGRFYGYDSQNDHRY